MNFPEEYRNDFAIIRETSKQLIKDFGIDFEIEFSGIPQLAFDEIKSQILPVISNLIKSDKTSFLALLYRVDVSEKEYKETLDSCEKDDFEERLTEVIIRREFKKVLTKRYFSK